MLYFPRRLTPKFANFLFLQAWLASMVGWWANSYFLGPRGPAGLDYFERKQVYEQVAAERASIQLETEVRLSQRATAFPHPFVFTTREQARKQLNAYSLSKGWGKMYSNQD